MNGRSIAPVNALLLPLVAVKALDDVFEGPATLELDGEVGDVGDEAAAMTPGVNAASKPESERGGTPMERGTLALRICCWITLRCIRCF